jgi:hypothetical protein
MAEFISKMPLLKQEDKKAAAGVNNGPAFN